MKRKSKNLSKNKTLNFLRYLGPGLLVTVGFIDPGNWASNIAAGSGFGYELLWMVTLSTVMLIVLQHNAAHLGIAPGLCLSEAASRYMPRLLKDLILLTAMLAAVATAMAEILGGAIALQMLFHIPIRLGSILILLQVLFCAFTNAYKRIEKLIILFVALSGFSFLFEVGIAKIDWGAAVGGWVKPSFPSGSMPVILSVLGAVVMPHNLFLHSEIIQSRQWNLEDSSIIASSVPADLDKTEYDLHKWEYTTYHKRAYLVYTEPTRWDTIRMMSGILFSSFLILLILILSFAYMFWFLIHQKTVEQLKDDFTHNVTHELKTPIAITYAAIEAMIHYNITGNKEKTNKYLHICHEEVLRLGNMVEQILSLGLERKKDFKLKYERVDLNGLLDKIVEQQSIKSSKPFHVGLESMPDRIILEADRTHLYNILSNILDNAIKYSGDSPHIQITAEERNGSVIIRITDNGIGIEEEHLAHIFDKFYRVSNSKRPPVRGYGIGQIYVKTMKHMHNGTIRVESQPGKGSCFIITLPQTHERQEIDIIG